MGTKIQVRRGLKADLPILDVGEMGHCIDTNEFFIGTATGNEQLTFDKTKYDSYDQQIESLTSSLADIAINVKKFSVKGDGVTDDTVAFKTLFDSIQDGATIFFPKGNYIIKHQGTDFDPLGGTTPNETSYMVLIKKKNIRIYGEKGTKITVNHDMTSKSLVLFALYGCENILIENIEVNYQASGHPNYTVLGYQTRAEVFLVDYHPDGTSCKNINIQGCKFRINHPEGSYPGEPYTDGGVTYLGSGKLIVVYFRGNRDIVPNSYASGLNVLNNEFWECTSRVIWTWYAEDVIVDNNRFLNCGTEHPILRCLTENRKLRFTNNYLKGVDSADPSYIILVNGQTGIARDVIIANNQIEGTGGHAVWLQGVENASITGNIIKSITGLTVKGYGVRVTDENSTLKSKNITISGNVIYDRQYGIGVDPSLDGNITIEGNQIYNCVSHGIYLYSNNCIVKGNTIFNNGGAGIHIQYETGATQYRGNHIISDNRIYGNTGRGISHSNFPYNVIVKGNHIENNLSDGIRAGKEYVISNNFIKKNSFHGITADGGNTNLISNNFIIDNNQAATSYNGIYIANGEQNKINDNYIRGSHSVGLAASSSNNYISGNDLRNSGTTSMTCFSNNKVLNNIFTDTNTQGGSVTINSGATSLVVTHGLPKTPRNFSFVSSANIGSIWVTGISDTQFTINCSTAPSSNTTVYWKAEI